MNGICFNEYNYTLVCYVLGTELRHPFHKQSLAIQPVHVVPVSRAHSRHVPRRLSTILPLSQLTSLPPRCGQLEITPAHSIVFLQSGKLRCAVLRCAADSCTELLFHVSY